MNGWRKIVLFVAIIIGPALLIGYCNLRVFPDALVEATGMLSIGVIVCGIFTWQSRLATQKIERYCTVAAVVICAALCINLGGHWLLAREMSAARQGVEERHAEADREEKRRAAEVARELMIAQAEIEQTRVEIERAHAERQKINAETRHLDRLPVERRTMPNAAPRMARVQREAPALSPTPRSAPSVPIAAEAQVKAPARLTPAEIVAKWAWFLTVMAFADCFLSVFSGAILFALWEWDPIPVAIPDHLQAPQAPGDPRWPDSIEVDNGNGGPRLGKKPPSW